jgi:hypothetical protein
MGRLPAVENERRENSNEQPVSSDAERSYRDEPVRAEHDERDVQPSEAAAPRDDPYDDRTSDQALETRD